MKNNKLENFAKELFDSRLSRESKIAGPFSDRAPVHVVYGGADLFRADTAQKLGRIAIRSLDEYAGNFIEFAKAVWLKGSDTLPDFKEEAEDLEFRLSDDPEKVKLENFPAWFAWTIYQKTIEKLKREPVEDFRIDFEDGYGVRSSDEEDGHAISASDELAIGFSQNLLPDFIGIRIKSFAPETRARSVRTLDLFLTNLLDKTACKLPDNFVVTLPKITSKEEVEILAELLSEFETKNALPEKSILIEIIVETSQAIVDANGRIALRSIALAANGRCISAHFGAYDYTSGFGISGNHQHLQHEACNFARQIMQVTLAPLGIRLSDSVTTELPIPVYRDENLTNYQIKQNKKAVSRAWRKHFNNVTTSLINGFYQSWDLHPAQLVARYAAVYAFFLESKDEQAKRLRGFLDKAAQAMMTGNQFDDAASAQGLLNFFARALNCGAISDSELFAETGLSRKNLNSDLFTVIVESRQKARAS